MVLTLKTAALVLLLLGARAAPAAAAEREMRGGFGLQANPLGVRAEVEAIWKKGAHVAIGISDQISPASNQTQVWLQVSPLAILDIRVGATGVAYFGTFGNLVGFGGYDSDFRDATRKARNNEAVSGLGRRFHVSPVLLPLRQSAGRPLNGQPGEAGVRPATSRIIAASASR